MNVSKKSLVLLAFSGLAVVAHATDVTSIAATNFPNGWYTADATNATASLDLTPSNDGDGALHLVGSGSSSVDYGAYPAYSGGVSNTFPSLGTLGALVNGSMSADFFRSSASNTINPYVDVSVKIIFSGNRQLTWENAYNSSITTQNSWFNQILTGSGEWWLRGAGLPAENNNNLHTLAEWMTGISPTGYTGAPLTSLSDVLGFSVGFGSGVGSFDGAIDHLNANFTGGSQYAFNFKAQATPEPASFAALSLGALAVIRRRKRA